MSNVLTFGDLLNGMTDLRTIMCMSAVISSLDTRYSFKTDLKLEFAYVVLPFIN